MLAVSRTLNPEDDGPDFNFGSAPALVTMTDGRDLLVIGQKSRVGYGLDPDRDGARSSPAARTTPPHAWRPRDRVS